MKYKIATIFTTIISSLAFATSGMTEQLTPSNDFSSTTEFGQGFRRDSLQWSVKGHHGKPDPISELTFKKINVYLTTLRTKIQNDKYLAEVDLGYGDVVQGTVRDSDWAKSHKRGEYSRSYHKITGDYTVDFLAKIGRIFHPSQETSFTPSLGYGAFWQKIRFKRGYNTIPKHCRANYSKLNSTYRTCWSAPCIDLLATTALTKSLKGDLGYTFFFPMQYSGQAHWNLRHIRGSMRNKPFKSFGQRGMAGLRFALSDRWNLGLSATVWQFYSEDGSVTSHQRGRKYRQPMKKASRVCSDYTLTLSYAF